MPIRTRPLLPSTVAAALAVTACLALPVAAHAAVAGPPTVVQGPATTETVVTEGQVKEAAAGGVIRYPSVTSCLTLTVRLGTGGAVAAHASLFQVPGELRSDRILERVKAVVGGRAVVSVDVRGAVGAWHPSYFSKAIESYGDGERVPVPEGRDVAGLASAVAQGLGVPQDKVTVADVPDGDQVVELPG